MWYSWEARKKAIGLYIKYGKSASAVIYELGYPSRHALMTWYQEYLESREYGDGEDPHKRKPRYTLEQKQAAVKHYIENGRNFSRTIRAMGYPTVQGLHEWVEELSPYERKIRPSMLEYAVRGGIGDMKRARPLVHSDRGGHYRWPGWLAIMEDAGLTRSMSKKACTPDNAACEGFFGRLKNEMFYNRSWHNVTTNEFMNILDSYLVWYNERRIKISLGAMSPLEYRRSLGFVA